MNDAKGSPDLNYTPHILVVRLSSLGDIILTSPVYRNIKEKWPRCEINVLVKPQFAAALAGNPHVDRVIPFRSIWHTLGIIRQLNITHFLDLHANLRTFIISALTTIPYKSRYSKDSIERRMFVKFGIPSPCLQRHVLDRYLDALKPWDIPIKYRDLKLVDWNYYKKDSAGQPQNASKICIYQTAFLGDAVLTAPLIRKTAELFPNAEITLVTRPETVDIFKPLREISLIIIDDKHSTGLLNGIRKMTKALRSRRFDVIIVPHRSFRSALIAWLSGAPVRVGFSSSAGKLLYNRLVPFSWLLHDTERNLSLLNAISPADITPAPVSFRENEKIRAEINSRLERLGCRPDRPLIGIHPGSAWFTKRWPPERFAMVIRLLYKTLHARAVLVGGKGDYELGEQICRLSRTDAINWTGKTDLPELMALMTRLRLFITNDSGPMHIATAFNVPTVGIFGPTTRELGFFPYGSGHRVIEKDLACRPCTLHGGNTCPREHFLCMRLITASEVFASSYEMLTGKRFDMNSQVTVRPAAHSAAIAPAAKTASPQKQIEKQPVKPLAERPVSRSAEQAPNPARVKYSPEPEYAPPPKKTERKSSGPKYFDGTNDTPPSPRPQNFKTTVKLVPVPKRNTVIFEGNSGMEEQPKTNLFGVPETEPAQKQKDSASEADKPGRSASAARPGEEQQAKHGRRTDGPLVSEDELEKWEKSLSQPETQNSGPEPVIWQNPEAEPIDPPLSEMNKIFEQAEPDPAVPETAPEPDDVKPARPVWDEPAAPHKPQPEKKPAAVPVPEIITWQNPIPLAEETARITGAEETEETSPKKGLFGIFKSPKTEKRTPITPPQEPVPEQDGGPDETLLIAGAISKTDLPDLQDMQDGPADQQPVQEVTGRNENPAPEITDKPGPEESDKQAPKLEFTDSAGNPLDPLDF
ncbi:MAG: lipopolysaccharide heptosyltransferase II [Elusimicrobiaceae bacterium]|nr:lipopolysaccharide heptosyltransferase II [Elusimicrobiaceae bacterium]